MPGGAQTDGPVHPAPAHARSTNRPGSTLGTRRAGALFAAHRPTGHSISAQPVATCPEMSLKTPTWEKPREVPILQVQQGGGVSPAGPAAGPAACGPATGPILARQILQICCCCCCTVHRRRRRCRRRCPGAGGVLAVPAFPPEAAGVDVVIARVSSITLGLGLGSRLLGRRRRLSGCWTAQWPATVLKCAGTLFSLFLLLLLLRTLSSSSSSPPPRPSHNWRPPPMLKHPTRSFGWVRWAVQIACRQHRRRLCVPVMCFPPLQEGAEWHVPAKRTVSSHSCISKSPPVSSRLGCDSRRPLDTRVCMCSAWHQVGLGLLLEAQEEEAATRGNTRAARALRAIGICVTACAACRRRAQPCRSRAR